MTRRFLGLMAIVVVIAGGWMIVQTWREPVPMKVGLPDGTEAYYYRGTRVVMADGFPRPRELSVDGDAFLRIPAGDEPMIVKTRLLVMTVTGETHLRVTARWKQTGEQAEVLKGQVVARKSYPSNFQQPDILTDGQMVMINQTIDLMEKEKAEMAPLRAWTEAIVAAARERKERATR